MRSYTVRRVAESLAVIDGRLWTRCQARKGGRRCSATNEPIDVGAIVYRPLLCSVYNRMDRVLASWVESHPIKPDPTNPPQR